MNSRIPAYSANNLDGVNLWFSSMANEGLLFHPDDRPEDIVSIQTGNLLFTENECVIVNNILKDMFDKFGDDVYEAAVIIFMKIMHIHS